MKRRDNPVYLGIDLGASLIKYMLLPAGGTPGPVRRIETDAGGGRNSVLEQIRNIISEAQSVSEGSYLAAVALGTPGLVNNRGELIGEAVNIPGWRDFNLREEMGEFTDLPVFVANDVSVTAFGEFRHGAGRQGPGRNLVCISIGTGIGGGLIVEGDLYLGTDGLAAEVGHLIVEPGGVPCECGQNGCLERYSSAKGIRRLCLSSAEAFSTPLARLASERPEEITAEAVYRFLRSGDHLAVSVNETACTMLARAAGQIINLLSPDTVVLCGGVMRSAGLILPRVLYHLEECSLEIMRRRCSVTAGELGSDAGVIGAAAYARQAAEGNAQ